MGLKYSGNNIYLKTKKKENKFTKTDLLFEKLK